MKNPSKPRSEKQLRDDALAIWQAGVDAVRPANLIPEWVSVQNETLLIGDLELALPQIRRIAVVGVGKAGAGMAVALEQALGPKLMAEKRLEGWVNVPADCIEPTQRIHLHPARPAGVNEPTTEAVSGTQEILNLVSSLDENDACLCLVSGGGSAMLPMPIEGISLEDKVALTREMSASGATIQQMNLVRRSLSQVKGGGLARACRAGRMISLILSDVLGDDLNSIASGPTVACGDESAEAVKMLETLGLTGSEHGQRAVAAIKSINGSKIMEPTAEVTNLVIGNNATAVDAAGVVAERLGYSHAMTSAREPEGAAEEIGRHLANMASTMRQNFDKTESGPDCLISGGEPVVKLAPKEKRGRGGRNQQLCLAALDHLNDWKGIALLSGGTDGEDGPTDAAGAIVTETIARQAKEKGLEPTDYLQRNDAYSFFEELNSLVKTGPTNTNVCDLRVITTSQGV
ncbi:MAG: DUF4147 domain-containing protein [Lacipirellulaceae bacterium]